VLDQVEELTTRIAISASWYARSLTEDEQHKIAGAIVEHLEQSNRKIEQGPTREGHGPHLMSR
jgi:hypothetical protein